LTQATLRFVLWTGHLEDVGYRNFDTPDTSNNWWLVALIGGGEGWHNNHHKFPRAANLGVKWWEFDPGYWVIRMIRR
jgi:stearoyl-CoA desaturase (delta-9 desaturase)